MEVDQDKVILSQPVMLCCSCFREGCNNKCWWIVQVYRRFKNLITQPKKQAQ